MRISDWSSDVCSSDLVRFVLDHCGKPDIATGLREPWRSQIAEMAALPNVVCKISGLVTAADWADLQEEDVLCSARAAPAAFGPARVLFGSAWPVNEVAGGYARWFSLAPYHPSASD